MSDYIHGIDVSKYQGIINWSEVALTQKFAFIRLGIINRDGTITIDPYFDRNLQGALAYGLQAGAYLYSYLESEDAAVLAANKAMDIIDDYGTSMPIALDYEHAALYQTMTKEKNAAVCNAFLRTVEAGGFIPLIYTYYAAAKAWLPLDQVPAPRWLANYTGRIGIDDVDIWQYSSHGSIPGIKGRVDMNKAFNGFWSKHPNAPLEAAWTPLHDKVLEVFGTRNTEYFNSLSVYDVAGVLQNGETYPVLGVFSGVVGGYNWASIQVNGAEYYVALLDDRCRITDAASEDGELQRLREENDRLRKIIADVRKAVG